MDLKELARVNRRQILKMLISTGGASRTEIARRTGIAMSSLTDITNKLVKSGIVVEHTRKVSGKRGRPALVLALKPENASIIVTGYDDCRIWAHLIEADGKIIESSSFELPPAPRFEESAAMQKKLIQRFRLRKWERVRAVVVLGPGVVDSRNGVLIMSARFGWKDKRIINGLSHLDKPVFLQNGSRLQALAENWYGAASDVDDFLFFHLDAGIGGAIVLDGILVKGPWHGAGEFGHMLIDAGGPKCRCGSRGCLEAVASMDYVVKAFGNRKRLDFKDIWELFEMGNKRAVEIFDETAGRLARGIVSAATTIGPKTVVLGGRMVSGTNGKIINLIRTKITKLHPFMGKLDIRKCQLSEEESSIRGAVAYALQQLEL